MAHTCADIVRCGRPLILMMLRHINSCLLVVLWSMGSCSILHAACLRMHIVLLPMDGASTGSSASTRLLVMLVVGVGMASLELLVRLRVIMIYWIIRFLRGVIQVLVKLMLLTLRRTTLCVVNKSGGFMVHRLVLVLIEVGVGGILGVIGVVRHGPLLITLLFLVAHVLGFLVGLLRHTTGILLLGAVVMADVHIMILDACLSKIKIYY